MPATTTEFVRVLASLTVWLVLLAVVFVPLERWLAVRPAKAWRAETGTDIGYYFINKFVPLAAMALLLGGPMSVLVAGLRAVVPDGYYLAVNALPVWAKLVLAFLIAEIGFYWGHRLSHAWPWLWRFHAVHHSAEHMDFLVNTRGHPVDMVFTKFCGVALLYVVGLAGPTAAGAATPTLVLLVGSAWGFLIHANLRWRLGPLEWLVATPAFHHWHHTRHDHVDRNYASMLPVFDRIFGTLHLPREWPAQYGTDTPVGRGVVEQFIRPFGRAVSPGTAPETAASVPPPSAGR